MELSADCEPYVGFVSVAPFVRQLRLLRIADQRSFLNRSTKAVASIRVISFTVSSNSSFRTLNALSFHK